MRFLLVLFVCGSLLGACVRSQSPNKTIRWIVSSEEREVAFDGLDCFFLSVSGSGVTETLAEGDLGSQVNASCLDLGTVSEVVDRTTLTTQGVELSVKTGPERRVRAMGLNTLDGTCEATLADNITATPLPQLYSMGEVTKDIETSGPVQIPNQIPSAQNLLTPPCVPNLRQYLYGVSAFGLQVEKIEVNPKTGTPKGNFGNFFGSVIEMCVDPLGKYVAYITNADDLRLCTIQPDGSLAGCAGPNLTPDVPRRCAFAPDGKFLYLAYNDTSSNGFVRTYPVNRTLDVLDSAIGTVLVGGGGNAVDFIQVFSEVAFAQSGSTTEFLLRSPTSGTLSTATADGAGLRKYFFHPFLSDRGFGIDDIGVDPPGFSTAEILGNGSVTIDDGETGSTLGLAGGSSESIGAGCATPNGKFVYLVAGRPPLTQRGWVFRIDLDGNGRVGSFTTAQTMANVEYRACAVHESGRRLYVGPGDSANATNSYSIDQNGDLVNEAVSGLTYAKSFGFATVLGP